MPEDPNLFGESMFGESVFGGIAVSATSGCSLESLQIVARTLTANEEMLGGIAIQPQVSFESAQTITISKTINGESLIAISNPRSTNAEGLSGLKLFAANPLESLLGVSLTRTPGIESSLSLSINGPTKLESLAFVSTGVSRSITPQDANLFGGLMFGESVFGGPALSVGIESLASTQASSIALEESLAGLSANRMTNFEASLRVAALGQETLESTRSLAVSISISYEANAHISKQSSMQVEAALWGLLFRAIHVDALFAQSVNIDAFFSPEPK